MEGEIEEGRKTSSEDEMAGRGNDVKGGRYRWTGQLGQRKVGQPAA